MTFLSRTRFKKTPKFQLGISLNQDSIKGVLLKVNSKRRPSKNKNPFKQKFKLIAKSEIHFDKNKAEGLSSLILEEPKAGFEMLITAVKELKTSIEQISGIDHTRYKTALCLPESVILFKTITLENKRPKDYQINAAFISQSGIFSKKFNLSDYHYDYFLLERRAQDNHYLFQFCLTKKALIEQIYSAFDLHQIEIELVSIELIEKLSAFSKLFGLSDNDIFALLKLSDNQIYFSSNHPEIGIKQKDKPLWQISENLVYDGVNFLDSIITSESSFKPITRLFFETHNEENNLITIEKAKQCRLAIKDYLKEYYPDCELIDINQKLKNQNYPINFLCAIMVAFKLSQSLSI